VSVLIQVTPIWKPRLEPIEVVNLRSSLTNAANRQLELLAPQTLDVVAYRTEFPHVPIRRVDDRHLRSVRTYNSMMLQPEFYRMYSEFEFLAIVQTDAFLVRTPHIPDFADVDYIGAPWIRGLKYRTLGSRLIVTIPEQHSRSAVRPLIMRLIGRTAWVGNGGLSIRRVSAHIRVTKQLEHQISRYLLRDLNEDVVLSTAGKDAGLRVASREVASRIFGEHMSIEQAIGRGLVGVHAPTLENESSQVTRSIDRKSDSEWRQQ